MKDKVKYLSKNVLLFTLSNFVPKVLAFFLIPIYTSCLSTTDYGLADLITTTASLFIPILTLDIQDAVLRFTMDDKKDAKGVFSISLKINSIGLAVAVFILFIIYCLNIFDVPGYFYSFLIFNYFLNALFNSVNLFCRGIDRVKTVVTASIINSVLTLSCNILFLVTFKLGIIGYLLANILGIFASIIYMFFSAHLYKYMRWKTDKKLKWEMIQYSFPLIFSVVAWWVNSASDRYILTWMCGVSISGLYAISYKIPNLLSMFQNIFAQAWSISAIKDYDKNDSDGFVGRTYTFMNFSMCALCSVIMIFNVFISKILYAGDFGEAWKFVPPLLLSVVFNAMALFIGSIFTAVKDTKTLSFTTIFGAVINIILNFILIHHFGAYGAAIATLVGYFIVLVSRNIMLKKYIHMKTDMVINYFAYVLLLIQIILAYSANKYLFLQIIIPFFLFFVYRKVLRELISTLKKIFTSLIHKSKI